mgnify:CR=1 FL=1
MRDYGTSDWLVDTTIGNDVCPPLTQESCESRGNCSFNKETTECTNGGCNFCAQQCSELISKTDKDPYYVGFYDDCGCCTPGGLEEFVDDGLENYCGTGQYNGYCGGCTDDGYCTNEETLLNSNLYYYCDDGSQTAYETSDCDGSCSSIGCTDVYFYIQTTGATSFTSYQDNVDYNYLDGSNSCDSSISNFINAWNTMLLDNPQWDNPPYNEPENWRYFTVCNNGEEVTLSEEGSSEILYETGLDACESSFAAECSRKYFCMDSNGNSIPYLAFENNPDLWKPFGYKNESECLAACMTDFGGVEDTYSCTADESPYRTCNDYESPYHGYPACNYDPEASAMQPGSCNHTCLGCTDGNACNYNIEATIDAGNCGYIGDSNYPCSCIVLL